MVCVSPGLPGSSDAAGACEPLSENSSPGQSFLVRGHCPQNMCHSLWTRGGDGTCSLKKSRSEIMISFPYLKIIDLETNFASKESSHATVFVLRCLFFKFWELLL